MKKTILLLGISLVLVACVQTVNPALAPTKVFSPAAKTPEHQAYLLSAISTAAANSTSKVSQKMFLEKQDRLLKTANASKKVS